MIDHLAMARQLGRWWGRNTTLGLTFCEPSSFAKSNIYATALPQRSHRLTPGVSITPIPGPPDEPMDATTRMTFRIYAMADTPTLAESITSELVGLLWPNQRPLLPREAEYYPGLIGVPSAAGTHTLWRATEFVQVATPYTGSARSAEGETVSQMAIEVHAVETTQVVE